MYTSNSLDIAIYLFIRLGEHHMVAIIRVMLLFMLSYRQREICVQ